MSTSNSLNIKTSSNLFALDKATYKKFLSKFPVGGFDKSIITLFSVLPWPYALSMQMLVLEGNFFF